MAPVGGGETRIRQAEPGDHEAVARLYGLLDALHTSELPRLFRLPPSGGYAQDQFRRELANPEVGFFVAERGGRIVGMVHVSIGETKPYPVIVPRRVAKVNDLAVDEGCRREGIGRALMERAAAWAAGQGADEMELSVYAFNEGAMAFYQALGFTVLSCRMVKP